MNGRNELALYLYGASSFKPLFGMTNIYELEMMQSKYFHKKKR